MRTTNLSSPFARPDYGTRQSRPDYFNAFGNGLGIVPRRILDHRTAQFVSEIATSPITAVRRWSATLPLVVLGALVDTHPMAQMALSNDLSAAFSPGDIKIVAVASEGDKDTDGDGTAAIDALWAALPPQSGGLNGLLWTLGEQTLKTGQYCVEGVPGAAGLADVIDFAPLTTRFRDTESGRVFEQQQYDTVNGTLSATGDWEELNPLCCLSYAWRGSRDNPYGMARYAAFLGTGLADVSDQSNLSELLQALLWPHLSIEFPWAEVVKFAIENPQVLQGAVPPDPATGYRGDLTPLEYASRQYDMYKDKIETLKAADTLMLPAGAKASILNAANLSGMEGTMSARRLRVVQSLDQLPILMGITEGSGTTQGSVEQTRSHYNKLKSFRSFVLQGPIAIANLHLRSLGLNLIARADTEPIQSRDKMAEAISEGQAIQNALELVDRGYLSDDEASIALTGSVPAVPELVASRRNVDEPPVNGLPANANNKNGSNNDNANLSRTTPRGSSGGGRVSDWLAARYKARLFSRGPERRRPAPIAVARSR